MLMRIDKVLSQLKIATRSESRKLFAAGRVMVNGETVKNGSFRFDPESYFETLNRLKDSYQDRI